MAPARGEWWIIGSAAVWLHGADPCSIADVDVILSEADARAILPRLGLPVAPGPVHHRFASRVFATWLVPPLRVEFMAGLKLREDGKWTAISPQTRVAMSGPGWEVFVPENGELVEILRRFGRPKDLARLAALSEAS